jgi:hypothetical protein
LLTRLIEPVGEERPLSVPAGPFSVDLFDVEGVARDRADVAHAVDVNAARGVEAAHVDGVAGVGGAVFAEEEGAHARGVAQRFGQGGGALLLDQFFLDDGQGLGGVDQLFGVLGGRGTLGLEVVLAAAADFALPAASVAWPARRRPALLRPGPPPAATLQPVLRSYVG